MNVLKQNNFILVQSSSGGKFSFLLHLIFLEYWKTSVTMGRSLFPPHKYYFHLKPHFLIEKLLRQKSGLCESGHGAVWKWAITQHSLYSWRASPAIWVPLSAQACKENIKASCSHQPQQMELICAVYGSFYNLGKSSRWWHGYLYPDFKAVVVPTVPKGSFPLQQSQTKVAVTVWVIQTFSAAPCSPCPCGDPRLSPLAPAGSALPSVCALLTFQALGAAFPAFSPSTAKPGAEAGTQMLLPVSNHISFLPDFSMAICSLELLFFSL